MDKTGLFELIGERYLDTRLDKDRIAWIEQELKSRGVTGFKRFIYEYIAASALWWNIFLWEWISITYKNILLGWILNGIIFLTAGILFYLWLNWLAGLIIVFVLHILTLWVGFDIRKGSIE